MQAVQSFKNQAAGTLYLVPTPIGNLGDITARALDTLRAVDLVAAEDTRHTQQLLNHFEIKQHLVSLHEHNYAQRVPQLIEELKAGKDVAQCSDAGMPSISDPGKELVAAAVKEGLPVVALPGRNAGLTALIASGLVPQPFTFYGFLPRKHQQQVTALSELVNRPETLIFYEAPHRLAKTLAALAEVFGKERKVVLARELTKRYEEYLRGSLGEAVNWAESQPVRGEFVLLVAGNDHPQASGEAPAQAADPIEQIDAEIARGLTTNAAIKLVAKQRGLKRQELYKQYHQL